MQIETMDPNILLSIINMKLRDQYDHLESLCDDLDFNRGVLEERLKQIGYIYNDQINQFI